MLSQDKLIKDLSLDKVKEIEDNYNKSNKEFRYIEWSINNSISMSKRIVINAIIAVLTLSVAVFMYYILIITEHEVNRGIDVAVHLFFLIFFILSILCLSYWSYSEYIKYKDLKNNKHKYLYQYLYGIMNIPIKYKLKNSDDNYSISTISGLIEEKEVLGDILLKMDDVSIDLFFKSLLKVYDIHIDENLSTMEKLLVMSENNNYQTLDEVKQFFKEDLGKQYNHYLKSKLLTTIVNKNK